MAIFSRICFAAMLLWAGLLPAQVVQNGSVTGSSAANSGINNGLAAFWSGCSFSPDLCDPSRPSYLTTSQVTPSYSPDGGTWLGVAALGECAETIITGLTSGQTYTLYFCGANFGTASLYNGPVAQPRVTVGASFQTFAIPQVASTWLPFSMNFTATSSTMVLRVDHPSGSNAYASLDGFNLTGIQCNPVILPESLSEFTAESKDCAVQLMWDVPEGYPVTSFAVQQSVNGDDFVTLEEISSRGAGMYETVDLFPTDMGYYRLRIVHEDGHVAFTETRPVARDCESVIVELAPNPVGHDRSVSLHVFSLQDQFEVTVAGLNGAILYRETRELTPGSWNEMTLPSDHWAAGMYFVRTSLGTSNKLVIQR